MPHEEWRGEPANTSERQATSPTTWHACMLGPNETYISRPAPASPATSRRRCCHLRHLGSRRLHRQQTWLPWPRESAAAGRRALNNASGACTPCSQRQVGSKSAFLADPRSPLPPPAAWWPVPAPSVALRVCAWRVAAPFCRIRHGTAPRPTHSNQSQAQPGRTQGDGLPEGVLFVEDATDEGPQRSHGPDAAPPCGWRRLKLCVLTVPGPSKGHTATPAPERLSRLPARRAGQWQAAPAPAANCPKRSNSCRCLTWM